MNTNVNTNVDFGTNNSNTNTTSSIGNTSNNSSPTSKTTYTSNGNVQTESMDLSFATEQVATESKSILDSIGDFFSDIGEGLKNTGARIVEGAKTTYNWAVNGLKELGSNIKEACTNLASNVTTILGSALTWAANTYIDLQSTAAVIGTTVVSGIADIGEGLVDGVAWTGGKLVEGGSWLVGKVAGWFSDDAEEAVMNWRDQAKTDVKEFISTDWIGKANDWFYQETALGQFINENSYLKYDSEAMQKLRGASEAVGKLVLATAATVVTGGAAAPIALGFLFGTGTQAEKVYQENPNTTGAQELGIFVSGLGEAANWYAQGKLGESGLNFLNVLKGNGIKQTGAALLQGFKSTLGNVKSNGVLNTLKGIWKNSNWASLMAKDNLADSAGIAADNVSDWLVGNEEMNVQTFMSASGELIAAWVLNMFFDGAADYIGNLGQSTDIIAEFPNVESPTSSLTAPDHLKVESSQPPVFKIYDSSTTNGLSEDLTKFLDAYTKDPSITFPSGIPKEISDYLQAYMKDPTTTLPLGIPQQISQYIDSKKMDNTIPLFGNSDVTAPLPKKDDYVLKDFFQPAENLPDTAPLFTTAPLPTAVVQTNLPPNITKFLDDFANDPGITVPQGIPQEVVDYLNQYVQDPLVTPPIGMPKDIIDYIESKSIATGIGMSSISANDFDANTSQPVVTTTKIKTPSQEKIELNQQINAEISNLNKWDPNYYAKLSQIQQKATYEMQLLEAIHNKGMTLEAYVAKCSELPQFDAYTTTLIQQEATAIANKAQLVEPSITTLMQSLEDGNSHLVGLDHKFKSQSSIESKISRTMAKYGYSPQDAASQVNDSLRYTLICEPGNYNDTVLEKLAKLKQEGYTIKWMNNAWGYSTYKGLNFTLTSPSNVDIELQFHTQSSFDVKQNQNHLWYEISRSQNVDYDIKNISDQIQAMNQSIYNTDTINFNYQTEYDINKAVDDYIVQLQKIEAANPHHEKLIPYLNIPEGHAFIDQIAAYPDGYLKYKGTKLPADAVLDSWGALQQYGSTPKEILSNIAAKHGKQSIQYMSATGTMAQLYLKSKPAGALGNINQIYGLKDTSDHILDFYSSIGIKARDVTQDVIKKNGLSQTVSQSTAEKVCEKVFKKSFASWAKAPQSAVDGMKYFTSISCSEVTDALRFGKALDAKHVADTKALFNFLDNSPGLTETTIMYRGLHGLDWVADGALRGKYDQELVDAINSLGGGIYEIADNSFSSSTPILGEGFTGSASIIEVSACPPGTKGAYVGKNSSFSTETEWLLNAGEGNKKMILGAELIDGKVYVYTQIIPKS